MTSPCNPGRVLRSRQIRSAALATAFLCLLVVFRLAAQPSPAPPAPKEIPVAFVLGQNAEVLDFTGPLEVFAHARNADGQPLFKPYFVAARPGTLRVSGGLRVVPDYTFANAPAPGIVVIPALGETPPAMLDWIRRVSRKTDLTMSVCTGAFVLAQTGLLDGKPATTHHGAYFRFAGTFPKVQLQQGVRYVEAGNLATAGGVTAGIDLALRVVERLAGREQAQTVAEILEYRGQGWRDPAADPAYPWPPTSTEQNPICPLCAMQANKSLRSDFEGRRFYFCSKEDKEYFEAHPELARKFLAREPAAPRSP